MECARPSLFLVWVCLVRAAVHVENEPSDGEVPVIQPAHVEDESRDGEVPVMQPVFVFNRQSNATQSSGGVSLTELHAGGAARSTPEEDEDAHVPALLLQSKSSTASVDSHRVTVNVDSTGALNARPKRLVRRGEPSEDDMVLAEGTVRGDDDQDCVWDNWEEWAPCSATCGEGERTRERVILWKRKGNGLVCDGDSEEDKSCNVIQCPLPVQWKSAAQGISAFSLLSLGIIVFS